MPRPKIGSYKKYLTDFDSPVPRTTAWLQTHLNNHLDHDQLPVPQGQVDDQPHHPIHVDMQVQKPDFDAATQEEHMDEDTSGSLSDSLSSSSDNIDEIIDVVHRELLEEGNEQRNLRRPASAEDEGSSSISDNDDRDLDEDLDEAAYVDEYPIMYHPDVDINEGVIPNVGVAEPHQIEEEHRSLLYNGCKITAAERDLLIMSFVIRWDLQDKGIEDLLRLIDCHMPYPVLGSKYLFLKKFPNPDQYVKYHYFCPECADLLDGQLDEEKCGKCGYICALRKN